MSDETSSVMSLIEEDPSVPSDLAPQSLSVETPALPSFVYALGRIEPRFPGLSLEKEFAQATGRSATQGLTDREAMHAVLTDPQNGYLVRQLAWVMTIEGVDTYLLIPRDPGSIEMLLDAVRPTPRADDVDVVIGLRGPIAPPEMANGLMVPIVLFDQIYSFDVDALVKALPKPPGISAAKFLPTAEEVFARIVQLADNAGTLDEHRALNYLAVRYDAIYAKTAELHARDAGLSSVYARTSRLSGVRRIVDIIFTFTHRQTDVEESYFVRVDVTEEFPFLVTKLSPYVQR
ncbi:MAG: hypothetical protein WCD11_33455 [Solirubrobacteraceae bacterium]